MDNKILLGHGSGGKLTSNLINEIFLKELGQPDQLELDDGAILPMMNNKLVFTTDSYVVNPIFFPGGNIGELAISGTVNDLAVMGATPLYISLGVILEEGLDIDILKRIVHSIGTFAKLSNVKVVCGDTKVVEKGKGDQIFINTSGIGELTNPTNSSAITPGDKIIINGNIGDHGMTLLTMRKGFKMESSLKSDCAPLAKLIRSVSNTVDIKWMRDPTRGGVATALNELVKDKNWGIVIDENQFPLHDSVKGLSEILGLDPLYSANEGKVLMVISGKDADATLKILRNDPLGKDAAIIGEISSDYYGKLIVKTLLGSLRNLGILNSDPLPRIC